MWTTSSKLHHTDTCMIWEHVRETVQRSGAAAQTRTRRQFSPTHARTRSFVAEAPGACHTKASMAMILLLHAVYSARPWCWQRTRKHHQRSMWQCLLGDLFLRVFTLRGSLGCFVCALGVVWPHPTVDRAVWRRCAPSQRSTAAQDASV